jgi:isopentenyldiphosphate isomerase
LAQSETLHAYSVFVDKARIVLRRRAMRKVWKKVWNEV